MLFFLAVGTGVTAAVYGDLAIAALMFVVSVWLVFS